MKKHIDKRKPETIIRELRWKLKRACADRDMYKVDAQEAKRASDTANARIEELEGMLETSRDLLKLSEGLRGALNRAQ